MALFVLHHLLVFVVVGSLGESTLLGPQLALPGVVLILDLGAREPLDAESLWVKVAAIDE